MQTADLAEKAADHLPVCADIAFTIESIAVLRLWRLVGGEESSVSPW